MSNLIGLCPGCFKKGKGSIVEIFAEREKNGDLKNIYIFGDDDFDMPSKDCDIKEVQLSEKKDSVTEITCPRCHEKVPVNIPIIEQLKMQNENYAQKEA